MGKAVSQPEWSPLQDWIDWKWHISSPCFVINYYHKKFCEIFQDYNPRELFIYYGDTYIYAGMATFLHFNYSGKNIYYFDEKM